MERHGLRSSEVLSIRYENIISATQVFVAGRKQSHDRFIVDKDLVLFAESNRRGRVSGKVFTITYDMLYYYMKKSNMGMRAANKKKDRVTHAPRARRIRNLLQSGLSLLEVRDEIGHKRIESTRAYLS